MRLQCWIKEESALTELKFDRLRTRETHDGGLTKLESFTELLVSILTWFSLPQVRVQVEDVNESPQFPPEVYKASIFSIAPYKTSVVYIKVNASRFSSGNIIIVLINAHKSTCEIRAEDALISCSVINFAL